MSSYVLRGGQYVQADEVFHAWTSGDLSRMLAALPLPTNAVDRHFLLANIVVLSYKQRHDPAMRKVCLDVGHQHVSEFPWMTVALRESLGGVMPSVPTFRQLATVLAEDGNVDEAIQVCQTAILYGVEDGTKGGFRGRIARLTKKKT